MKKIYITAVLFTILIVIMGFINCNKPLYTNIPNNAFGTGTVIDASKFSDWIGNVQPALNVFVKPADSPNFVGDNDTSPSEFDRQDFFRWSEQMFFWILSPVPANGTYGTCNGLVLNSPEFFDFYNGTYVRHSCNNASRMSFDVKAAQNGKHNLPLFFEDKTEKVYDVDATPKSELGYQLVKNENCIKIEVGSIKVSGNIPTFFDRNDQVIKKVNLIIGNGLDAKTTIQQFHIVNQAFAILMVDEFTPIVIFPIQSQANGNNVLMARNGSLVYYNIMVNDVYAVFSKMVSDPNPIDHVLPLNSLFPTTIPELDAIKVYGAAHSIPIIDTDNRVLAMELKTSWVETTNLTNSDKYVKIRATIPNYIPDPNIPNAWTRNGTRTTELALVGMHVVGSALGHPEMIWSTFEHLYNTPNAPGLNYIQNIGGSGEIVSGLGNTDFLFHDSTITSPFNVPHITGAYDLSGANGFNIQQPSNTLRNQAFGWGGLIGQFSGNNPVDILPADDSNAQLIAINTDANNKLLIGDVRKNYFQVGSTWSSRFESNQQAGTIRLSNSTMETYTQATGSGVSSFSTASGSGAGLNCFSCHDVGFTSSVGTPFQINPPHDNQLSHVFGRQIVP